MAKYVLSFAKEFDKHLERFRKSGDKQSLKKIDVLLKEIEIHPTTATGKPEQLKGLPNYWHVVPQVSIV